MQCLCKSGSFFGQKNQQKTNKVLLINTPLTVRGTETENVQEKDRNLHIYVFIYRYAFRHTTTFTLLSLAQYNDFLNRQKKTERKRYKLTTEK